MATKPQLDFASRPLTRAKRIPKHFYREIIQESELGGYQEIWQRTSQSGPQETSYASQDPSPQKVI